MMATAGIFERGRDRFVEVAGQYCRGAIAEARSRAWWARGSGEIQR
jgi:hypothetical protein